MIAVMNGELNIAGSEVRVAISVITRLELLAWPELSPQERELVRDMLNSVDVLPITLDIEEKVIEIRSTRSLKLPDAIVAATALSSGAPLVTNDAGFSRVVGL